MRRLRIGFHSTTPINAKGSSYGARTMATILYQRDGQKREGLIARWPAMNRNCAGCRLRNLIQRWFNDPSPRNASSTSTAWVLSQVGVFEYLFQLNNRL
jgi:hypothetical protein